MNDLSEMLDRELEALSQEQSEPRTLALFNALHFLREAMGEGKDGKKELQVLSALHRAHPDPRSGAVLTAMGELSGDLTPDPLEPLLQAASLPRDTPEPVEALENWIKRQALINQGQQLRLEETARSLARAQQATQVGSAVVVVLLAIVGLLLLIEGGWLDVPDPIQTPTLESSPGAPVQPGPGGQQ